MTTEARRLQRGERWLAWIRLAAVPFAVVQTIIAQPFPAGQREAWAWASGR